MNYQAPFLNTKKVDKTLNSEQFNQIVEAILNGKYSWACVLLLRSFGHNPLHYIPYRTYNRLIKEDRQIDKMNRHPASRIISADQCPENRFSSLPSQSCPGTVTDLSYLEEMSEQRVQLNGKGLQQWSDRKKQPYNSLKVTSVQHKKSKSFLFDWWMLK